MDMDPQLRRLPDSNINTLELENDLIFSAFKQSEDIPDTYIGALSIPQRPDHAPSMGSDRMIEYLNQILLEEDIDDENTHDSFWDPIALRDAENSLYEALLGKTSSHFDTSVGSYTCDVGSTDLSPGESFGATDSPALSIQPSSYQRTSDDLNHSSYNINIPMVSRMDAYLSAADSVPNGFCDLGAASVLQFKRGVEEARKFLLPGGHEYSMPAMPPLTEQLIRGVVNIEREDSADTRRGRRKHCCPDESVLEGERSKKQSAVNTEEEVELSEMLFDKVLLCADEDNDPPTRVGRTEKIRRSGRKSHSKKQGEVVDLETLLTSCAQYVSDADYKAAVDELKKIRQYSSPTGNARQRLAHAFADSLEARLAGTGTQLYVPPFRNNNVASGLTKSNMTSWVPFMRLIYNFSNQMIHEAALGSSSLHVIDFGILHGIQWPTLIRDLSQRPGGPPRLRITGIELPQPGFRPSQLVIEAGVRLEKYCQRFGVPFEYNAITAQHWEAIKIDDLKLASGGEVVAVNCVFRFKRLLDETMFGGDSPCPRDAVLNLIREVNPRIFVHNVYTASHGSPFFLTRFREALYLYSVFYDLFDAHFPGNDDQRFGFEQGFMGAEIRNIIACEGTERIERPETYKQWHSRTMRAGFEPLPLKPQLVEKLIGNSRAAYHKDFLFTEDGHWVLQGVKGRIVSASSCWAVARQIHHKR
ncbi:unnamed protein product [Cuscuta epithymum]|uniref:Uncharacterized protein n=1 Tax=Cuscuta epithymum TaxID=186058 RepID=A0AAV0CH30_9ASTE|nr:unnamed protein product [Cuscuta epithymum]